MNCPICSSNSISVLKSYNKYFQCDECKFCFQDPLPNKVYEGPEEGGVGPGCGHLMSDHDKQVNRLLANKLYQRFVPKTVLDIGSKYPFFLSVIKDRADVVGIDAIPSIGKYGEELGVPVMCMDFEESKFDLRSSCDLITLIHTMEHFYRPIETMTKVKNALTDDGVIFVRVPNIDRPGIEREFNDHHLLIHPYIYSKKSIEILAELIGCKIFDSDDGYGQSDFYLNKRRAYLVVPNSLSVCMIAKNEENNIGAAINSVIDVADEIIVVDTGSTDNTVKVANHYAKVRVESFPWIDDFSAARNISLQYATSEWTLWIDCDDTIDNPQEIINTIKSGKNLIYDCIIRSGNDEWKTTRLFKNGHNVHFAGRIHECLAFKTPLGDSKIRITHHVHKEKSEDRVQRNLRILRKEIEDNPSNPRSMFYLGQALRSAKQYDEAIGVYHKYIYFSLFNEERWMAQCDIGRIYMFQKIYPAAIEEFMKCRKIDDRWREHDYWIGECEFLRGNYQRCIDQMLIAINKPEPNTKLWKDKPIYRDAPYRYLFASYERINDYKNALKYCLIVKEMLPDDKWISDRCEYFHKLIGVRGKSNVIECFRWGALGDVLMTTAALRGLKEAFPGKRIRYITHPNNVALLENNKYVDEISSVSNNDTDYKVQFCYPEKEGYPEKPLNRHLVRIFNECAGLPGNSMDLECTLTEDEEQVGIDMRKRYTNYVTMHIQSGWSIYKDWKFERWVEIARFLQARGLTVVQIGGAENPAIPDVVDARGMPIKYSVAAIKYSKFHIGVDSFSNHASWAVKKPSLILFGSTSPKGFGYSQNVNVYMGMKCQPCHKENPEVSNNSRGPCPINGECMERISVSMIENILEERFLS